MASNPPAAALKLAMAATLAAWAFVWALKPTHAWKTWWHAAQDWAAAAMLAGDTGLSVVVFCLPMLALATLVYVYLHLRNKEDGRRDDSDALGRRNRFLTGFTNPFLVDSPFGVLSAVELVVVVMFVAFLAWTFYANISSDLKTMAPSKTMKLTRSQLRVMYVGVRIGSLSEACLAMLLLPVLRGMSVFRIFGIQFEASVRYHVWIANVMILLSVLHGVIIMSVWRANKSFLEEITKWQRVGRVNLAGEITLAVGLIIWITSLPYIRRKQFQLFYSVHHLYTIFILFFLLHAGAQHFYLVFSGVLLFALDKVLRIFQSRREIYVLSARILQCKAVELTLPKHPNMKYTATSVIFVNIPSISKFQWHPFSITSSSNVDRERLSVLVKCQGQWTDSLYSMIHSMVSSESSPMKSLAIAVEGPFGPPDLPYQRYSSLFLIAGGSGITPFLSIIQDIDSGSGDISMRPTRIQLIYVVKRSEDISMLSPITPLLLSHTSEPLRHLKLTIFVTQEEARSGVTAGEILQEMSQVETIIMNPIFSVDELAIPPGLLGKAAMTVLSSLIFLASLLCLSYVFVHQEKRSKESKSPSWIGDMIVICSFIIAASCSMVAILGLKRRKSEDEVLGIFQKHSKAEEMHTMEVREAAQVHFVGPQRGAEEFQINFGKRPNLIDVLMELTNKAGESNAGFFVCGPDSMQRSVASFCRSSNGKCVFTFHSINFSL